MPQEFNIINADSKYTHETIRRLALGRTGPEALSEALGDGLRVLMETQMDINKVTQYEEGHFDEALRTYALALQVELAEFIQELNWKPWKKAKAPDYDRVMDEFADVLAFLGHILRLLHALDIGPYQLADAFQMKTKINFTRLSGYGDDDYNLD